MTSKIKLIPLGEPIEDGTQRLQAQLSFFRKDNVADFILKDSILKVWRHGNNGIGFYETDEPYEIVNTEEEMRIQKL